MKKRFLFNPLGQNMKNLSTKMHSGSILEAEKPVFLSSGRWVFFGPTCRLRCCTLFTMAENCSKTSCIQTPRGQNPSKLSHFGCPNVYPKWLELRTGDIFCGGFNRMKVWAVDEFPTKYLSSPKVYSGWPAEDESNKKNGKKLKHPWDVTFLWEENTQFVFAKSIEV